MVWHSMIFAAVMGLLVFFGVLRLHYPHNKSAAPKWAVLLGLLTALLVALATSVKAHGDDPYQLRIGPTPDLPNYETPFYDVDTIWVTVDLGFRGMQYYGPLRIWCIDGAEIRPLRTREIATIQRDFGASLAAEGARATGLHLGEGKFGRSIFTLNIGGINYAATVYAEFTETMSIEAYSAAGVDECREHLGVSPPEAAGP